MSPSFFRLPLRGVVAVAVMAGVAAAPAAAFAASGTPTAASVIKAANAGLTKEAGVHIVAMTTTGKTKSRVVVDLGKSTGLETIYQGSDRVTIALTAKDVYVSGTTKGMITIMGLSKAQEKLVGSKSIAMAAGSSPYVSFKARLTTASLLSFLPAAKGTTLLPVVSGSGHYQLKWTIKGSTAASDVTSVLILSSSSPTLPISETITGTSGDGTTTFSKWGESFTVPIPSSSSVITYKKVFG